MKVLLAVMSCEAHSDRHPVIKDTWGQNIPEGFDLRFFTGQLLQVPDDYSNLWQKTKAICQWAVVNNYDYLARIDTDTYVHVPRLLLSGFEDHDLSGYVRHDHNPPYTYGPCYWMSRKAFTLVAEADWPAICKENSWGSTPPWDYEDVMAGAVLARHGIHPHHDDRYGHWHPVLPTNTKIIEHLNSTGGYTHERMYEAHKNAWS